MEALKNGTGDKTERARLKRKLALPQFEHH